MNFKIYKKPLIIENKEIENFVPIIGLLAGYAAGRSVAKAMEFHNLKPYEKLIEKVITI